MRLSTKLILLFLFIIILSIMLISWRGLDYFISDKETYVQDINAQNLVVLSNFLADRVSTLSEKISNFSELVNYRFKDTEAQKKALNDLAKSITDFSSIAYFKIDPPDLAPGVALYSDAGLKQSLISRQDISNRDFILGLYKSPKGVRFRNITKNSLFPQILMYLKKDGAIVVATLPQKSFLNIISDKAIYTAFVVDGDGNLVMHQEPAKLLSIKSFADHPMVKRLIEDKEKRFLSGTGEYYDPETKEQMLASYAHVGDTGLGLVVQMPKKLALAAARELVKKLAIWVTAILAVAIVVTMVFSSTITRPLKSLADFASKVGKGEFNAALPKKTNDELGELVSAFNAMSTGLKERDEKIEATHKQLVQSEKMSAFGAMSAGIAHEVKNPLAGILGYAQIAKKKAPPEAGVGNYLDIIEKETKRCKEIVENLMKFARAEKAAFGDIDIVQVVRDSVALVDHQISITGNKIVRNFPAEGVKIAVNGNANQITQVLTNIMLNANYAMKKKGEGGVLTVGVEGPKDGSAFITIQDTGTGIKEEHLTKIFEPFFTTKPAGEGTGLGLSVTYGIVKDHKGEIKAESKHGEWTRFTIQLPVKQA